MVVGGLRIGRAQRQLVGLVAVCLVAGAVSAKATAAGRIGVGVLVLAAFATVVFSNRMLALTVTVGWLIMLGFTRRILIPFTGWSTHDPLLLFGMVAAILLWASSARGVEAEEPPPRGAMLVLAIFLLGWSLGEVVNPNQQNLVANLQGELLFWVAPLLWFFAARRFRDEEHERVLLTILALTPVVLFYGLWQTFIGFFPIDLHWVGVSGFGPALFLNGFKLRPWSVLTSPQEYGVFLAMTAMVSLSRAMTGRRLRGVYLGLFGLSGLALFLQGSRGTFLAFLAGFTVLVVARARSLPLTLAVMVFASLLGLVIAGHAKPVSTEIVAPGASPATVTIGGQDQSSTAGALVQHQTSFFDNPNNSTLAIHEQLVFSAFGRGLANPFGLGSAVATIAGIKAGSAVPGAESDIANVGQAFGVPGLVAYLSLMVLGFVGAATLYRRRRASRHLAWLGILVVGIDQWWQGGLYCTSALAFIVLGGIARELALDRGAMASGGGSSPASANLHG